MGAISGQSGTLQREKDVGTWGMLSVSIILSLKNTLSTKIAQYIFSAVFYVTS